MRVRVTPAKRSFAKSLRGDSTEAEAKLWRLLRSRRLADFKFRRQVPIVPYIVDFVYFDRCLIVEADGSQHADSDRDVMRDQDLAARGFRVLRFWNNDILQKPTAVAEAIFANLNASPSPGAQERATLSHYGEASASPLGRGKKERVANA